MSTQKTSMTENVTGWFADRFKHLQGVLSSMGCYDCFGEKTEDTTEASSDTEDLSNLKLVDLKSFAKERGLKGYSGLRKAQLIDLLSQN